MKVKRAALYLRVSTDDQTTENQRRELRAVVERAGWRIFEVYEDAGISGAKGRDQRPAFDQMLKAVAQRRFDVVMAWSVDRLGRSLPDLAMLLRDLHAAGCDLYLHRHHHAGRPRHVSDDGRLCRARTRAHSGAGQGRHGARQGAGQACRPASDY